MRAVLASRNTGKLSEMRALLSPHGFTLSSQDEFDLPSAEETGITFIENALIKARSVSAATGLPSIADDSGLVVPALDGAPGVRSARYAGETATDQENNARLVAALRALDDDGPVSAYFCCVMVYLSHAGDPTPAIGQGRWHGEIVLEPAGLGGFGYDPHFFVPEEGCTAAEMPAARKAALSHRGQAAQALLTAMGA